MFGCVVLFRMVIWFILFICSCVCLFVAGVLGLCILSFGLFVFVFVWAYMFVAFFYLVVWVVVWVCSVCLLCLS